MNAIANKQTKEQNPASLELVSQGLTSAPEEKKISKPPSSIFCQMACTLETVKQGRKLGALRNA